MSSPDSVNPPQSIRPVEVSAPPGDTQSSTGGYKRAPDDNPTDLLKRIQALEKSDRAMEKSRIDFRNSRGFDRNSQRHL